MPFDPISAGFELGGSVLSGLLGNKGQQKRKSFRGTRADPITAREKSGDYLAQLQSVLEGMPPLDLSGGSAPLPMDPGGRVTDSAPRRRPMSMPMSGAPPPMPGGEGDVDPYGQTAAIDQQMETLRGGSGRTAAFARLAQNKNRPAAQQADRAGGMDRSAGALRLLRSLGGGG